MKKPMSPELKEKLKKIQIAGISGAMAASIILGTIACGILGNGNNTDKHSWETTQSDIDDATIKQAYKNLQQVRKTKLPVQKVWWTEKDGSKNMYLQADEQDVLELSKEMSVAVQDYYRACGATFWVSDKEEQFWPEDIEYIVAAIAFNESSYRTDCINNGGKGGITGIYESAILKTLGEEWLVPHIWGTTIPQLNCNPEQVDIFNPTTCLELTYINGGYNFATCFKQDKYFIDDGKLGDGKSKSVWTVFKGKYDNQRELEELRQRLFIAAHRFGRQKVIDAIYDRAYDAETKQKISLDDILYGSYTNSVINKAYDLKQEYKQSYGK